MTNEISTETSAQREARWKKVLTMTDEENEANIASDPDSQVPNNPEFLRRGRMVYPDGTTTIPVTMDAQTSHWMDEHPMDYQLFLSSVLKAYVQSQQKHS